MTYFDRITDPVLLISFLIFCIASFLLSLFFVKSARYFFTLRGKQDLYAIQSAHEDIVPRLGGLALFLTLLVFILLSTSKFSLTSFFNDFNVGSIVYLLVSALPIFILGLSEDLGYFVAPLKRLLASIISGTFVILFLNVWVTGVGFVILDSALSFGLIGIIFTLFATSGVVNAFNLIDGLNGLASFVGISTAITLSYIAFEVNQVDVMRFLFIFSACILGFTVLNFPVGKIFLGDAGAYLIGHLLVWTAIILVNHSSDVSPFAILLIFFWPVADTCLAIWRRKRKNRRAYKPDRLHFHQLVMRFLEIRFLGRSRRRISNPIATIILFPFVAVPQILGAVFWNNFAMALFSVIIMSLLFFCTYLLGIHFAQKTRPSRM